MILEAQHPMQNVANAYAAAHESHIRWRNANYNDLKDHQQHNRGVVAAKRRCGSRVVSRNHYFKHSRAFLWLLVCNMLAVDQVLSQLLINVQNQVRTHKENKKSRQINILTAATPAFNFRTPNFENEHTKTKQLKITERHRKQRERRSTRRPSVY